MLLPLKSKSNFNIKILQTKSINIAQAFFEIEKLKVDFLLSMPKIEWWLLKYSDQYKKITKKESNEHLFQLDDCKMVSLPPFWEKTENQTFLDLYSALNELSNFHRFENYFKQQMSELRSIKSSKIGLKKWLLHNEKLGTEKFACFLIDYLDYDEDDKIEHLNIFVDSAKELNIYVDKADFKNTVDFLENFNELYW
jgi:hypothetical protein